MRKHPDAAVFVAELDNIVVGRLSVARDPHPASRHVADLGLMVAAGARRRGVGFALLGEAATFVREGYRTAHYRRGREYVDAILMAYELD